MVEKTLIVSILTWAVPFLLGLFASLIIDTLRKFKKNRRNKAFIILYLGNTIKPTLIELEKAYKQIKDKIKINKVGHFSMLAFENFNTRVLNAIQPVEYYEIFKEQYVDLDEIITMIDFISNDLPIKINDDYWNYLNEHVKLNNATGDYNHIEKCEVCINHKKGVLNKVDSRIKETKDLIEKIDKITNKTANKG